MILAPAIAPQRDKIAIDLKMWQQAIDNISHLVKRVVQDRHLLS